MTADSPPRPDTVVLQGLPGIGDALWHLSGCRAIAATSAARRIVLAAPARTQGARLFAAEPWLAGTIDLRRGWAGLPALVRALRAGRFARAVILHHSPSLALAAWLARIPRRHGFGFGAQRRWLAPRAALDPALRAAPHRARIDALLTQLGIAHAVADQPLALTPAATRAVAARLGALPSPFLALGVGASESFKRWPLPAMTRFVDGLDRTRWPSVLLLGSRADAALAAALRDGASRPGVHTVCDLAIDEAAALLAEVAHFVGPDSGLLNLALAMGRPAIGLFGATAVLRDNPRLTSILPPGGPGPDGMAAIKPELVLAALAARG